MAQLSRELSAYFNSALAYVTLTVFLAVMGVVFTLNIWHASAFTRPMDYGQTLNYLSFFAMLLAALITMRLFAEEKNRGTIEILMTCPITDTQVVFAKFLGAVGFFGSLILPTGVFVAVMAKYASVDGGAILMGYFGILVSAAAFISIGMLISALSNSQMVAGIVSILISLMFITVSVVGGLIRDNESVWKRVLLYLSFNAQASSFMQGIFDTRPLVFFGGIIAVFLFATMGVVGARRWRDRRVSLPMFLLTLALLAANLSVVCLISERFFVRRDMTKVKRWELTERTIQVLRKLKEDIYVVAYPFEGNPQMTQDATLTPAWDRFSQFMSECQKYSDRIHWQELRPKDTQVTLEMQKIFKSLEFNTVYLYTDKKDDGARKSISIREMYDGNSQTGQITRWFAEPKLLQAINTMVDRPKISVYYTAGHREIGIRDPKDFGMNLLANKLYLLENVEFVNINVGAVRQIPLDCQLLMILGPTEPFNTEECQVLDDYLNRGGALFLTVVPESNTGLNKLMDKWGVVLDQRRIRVSGHQLDFSPGLIKPHHINQGFENVNYGVFMPSVVSPKQGLEMGIDAVPLMVSGPGSQVLTPNPPHWEWAPVDREGFCLAVAVAVLDPKANRVKTRIVTWGTTANLWNQNTAAYQLLGEYFLNTFKWLVAKEDEVLGPPKIEEEPVRLSEKESWIVAGISVIGLPLLGVALGLVTFFMRRK